MNLKERLADAHQRSVSLYLRRSELESQRQQIAMDSMRCDQGLIKLDAEIELLTKLLMNESDS